MKSTSSMIALLVLATSCTQPHEHVQSGSIPPQTPPIPMATPSDMFDGSVPFGDAGPAFLCTAGKTLDSHPQMPKRICLDWQQFADPNSQLTVRSDGGIASFGTASSFECPSIDDLVWASGERCGSVPVCEAVETQWILDEDAGDDDAGAHWRAQQCCYVIEHWCGV